MNKQVIIKDLGNKDYKETWDYQESLFEEIVAQKTNNKANGTNLPTTNYFLFVEHPHVYTLGKSGHIENLLIDEEGLKNKGATFYKINRGGDITYHGPGQIVGYPRFRKLFHRYPQIFALFRRSDYPYSFRLWSQR